MTHHCLLSHDSSQVPCQQAIMPNSNLALAQTELLGKADFMVNRCKSRTNKQKKRFERINRCKSRTNKQKKRFGKTKSHRKHHELKSELIRTDIEKSAYLCRGYILGGGYSIGFSAACKGPEHTKHVFTSMFLCFF